MYAGVLPDTAEMPNVLTLQQKNTFLEHLYTVLLP